MFLRQCFLTFWALASHFVQCAEELGKCSQALTIITEPHKITDSPDARPLKVVAGRVTFDKVTFYYDQGINVFTNESVIIEPGQRVGLVGFSGSGENQLCWPYITLF